VGKLGSINANGKDVGGYGWEHILYNHVYYGNPAEHFATVLGSNYATEAQVKQLIDDTRLLDRRTSSCWKVRIF
jgi:hypothetical protein